MFVCCPGAMLGKEVTVVLLGLVISLFLGPTGMSSYGIVFVLEVEVGDGRGNGGGVSSGRGEGVLVRL